VGGPVQDSALAVEAQDLELAEVEVVPVPPGVAVEDQGLEPAAVEDVLVLAERLILAAFGIRERVAVEVAPDPAAVEGLAEAVE
jgi:hypothetical protein